jgi:hypothetical protein
MIERQHYHVSDPDSYLFAVYLNGIRQELCFEAMVGEHGFVGIYATHPDGKIQVDPVHGPLPYNAHGRVEVFLKEVADILDSYINIKAG